MDAAKSYDVSHTREYILDFSSTIRKEDSSFQSNLRIYYNRKEPVDVLYQFAPMNSVVEFLT